MQLNEADWIIKIITILAVLGLFAAVGFGLIHNPMV
jgi:hypothetical protein